MNKNINYTISELENEKLRLWHIKNISKCANNKAYNILLGEGNTDFKYSQIYEKKILYCELSVSWLKAIKNCIPISIFI